MMFNFNVEKVVEFLDYRMNIGSKKVFAGYRILSEDMLSVSDEELDALMAEWDEVEKQHKMAIQYNRDLLAQAVPQLEAFCKMLGFGTYKKSKYGKLLGEYKEFKMLRNALEKKIRTWASNDKPSAYEYVLDGERRNPGRSCSTLKEMVAYARKDKEQKEKMELRLNKLYQESVKFLANKEIEMDGLSVKQIISKADGLARDAWIASNFPDGETVDVDDNICECETWTVGDRRCSCGNRRLELSVEGDLSSGFYGYPVPF